MLDYKTALENFIRLLQERENCSIHYPKKFYFKEGRKYDKIIREESVYAFINKETGGILKPASWSAPDRKKYERGNIFHEDPLHGTNVYGVNSL